MRAPAERLATSIPFPVRVHIAPTLGPRNRLTTLFRPVLAIPHLLLVGGPMSAALWWIWDAEPRGSHEWSAGGGALGAVAIVCAIIAWFAVVATGRHPNGLWQLGAFYVRWRVRAGAYATLLADEYPPFGDAPYRADAEIEPPAGARDRLAVAFRMIVILPHLAALWILGFAWIFSTGVAWLAILFTGYCPELLYRFGVGMLRWNARVEAYALLLVDDYPPFSLDE